MICEIMKIPGVWQVCEKILFTKLHQFRRIYKIAKVCICVHLIKINHYIMVYFKGPTRLLRKFTLLLYNSDSRSIHRSNVLETMVANRRQQQYRINALRLCFPLPIDSRALRGAKQVIWSRNEIIYNYI